MDDLAQPALESISAVTLGVRDMARSVRFYAQLGFALRYGGAEASFTSFQVGPNYLNLVRRDPAGWWGRLIFYVSDVDAIYARVLAAGIRPEFEPRDAPWGERYFHVRDPDGHELSFARPPRRVMEQLRLCRRARCEKRGCSHPDLEVAPRPMLPGGPLLRRTGSPTGCYRPPPETHAG